MKFFATISLWVSLSLTCAAAMADVDNNQPSTVGAGQGHRVTPPEAGGIYENLENGGVITGAHGQPVNDPKSAIEMRSELKTETQLQVDGEVQEQPIHYEQSAPKGVDDNGDEGANR